MDFDKGLETLVTTCTIAPMRQPVFHYTFAWCHASPTHSFTRANLWKMSKGSVGAGTDFGSAVIADAFFSVRMSCRTCCRSKKAPTTSFPEQQQTPVTQAHVTCCVLMYGSLRPENLTAVFLKRFLEKQVSRDRDYEKSSPFCVLSSPPPALLLPSKTEPFISPQPSPQTSSCSAKTAQTFHRAVWRQRSPQNR